MGALDYSARSSAIQISVLFLPLSTDRVAPLPRSFVSSRIITHHSNGREKSQLVRDPHVARFLIHFTAFLPQITSFDFRIIRTVVYIVRSLVRTMYGASAGISWDGPYGSGIESLRFCSIDVRLTNFDARRWPRTSCSREILQSH